MHIARAKPDDAETLTRIALAAKRSWGYPDPWMESWREVLTIQPKFIATHETYVAVMEGRILGFYALSCDAGHLRLEHLWVLPAAMKQGIGRAIFAHALDRARALGFQAIEIESDPNAEGFYQRMGARRVGQRISEMDGERRVLPLFVCETRHVD